MGRIVQEISKRFDIVSFLQRFTEVRPYNNMGEWMILCPYCPKYGYTPKWRPIFNVHKGIYHCFRCTTHGFLVDLVMEFGQFPDFGAAIRYMEEGIDERDYDLNAEISHESLQRPHVDPELLGIKDLPAFPEPPNFISLVGQQIPYTQRRRLSQEVIDTYGLGYCPPGSVWADPTNGRTYDYSNRLILPDRDINGRLLYWVARDMTDRHPQKYMNPPSSLVSIGSGSMLFNFHRASQHRRGVLVEGYLDALRVGSDAMATSGMGVKRHHKNWLLRGGFEEIVLLYDGDGSVPPKHIQEKATDLAQRFKIFIASLPYGGDPDNYSRHVLREIIEEAKPFDCRRLAVLDISLK